MSNGIERRPSPSGSTGIDRIGVAPASFPRSRVNREFQGPAVSPWRLWCRPGESACTRRAVEAPWARSDILSPARFREMSPAVHPPRDPPSAGCREREATAGRAASALAGWLRITSSAPRVCAENRARTVPCVAPANRGPARCRNRPASTTGPSAGAGGPDAPPIIRDE